MRAEQQPEKQRHTQQPGEGEQVGDGPDPIDSGSHDAPTPGRIRRSSAYAVVATAGIVLAAAYVLWMVQRTTQGIPNPALAEVPAMRKDITLREKVVVAPLILLLLFLGFYPKPVTDVINPAVQATMHDVGTTDPGPTAVANGKVAR